MTTLRQRMADAVLQRFYGEHPGKLRRGHLRYGQILPA